MPAPPLLASLDPHHAALTLGRQTIAVEIDALKEMAARLDAQFEQAIDIAMNTEGRLIVMGMGKSGIIGNKIAATLASTGTCAFAIHPGEAYHGDLGMIKPIDTALLISNSGETEELVRLLPFLQHQGNRIIAITGKPLSTLAKNAHAVLDVSVPREACNNNLAPTSSTTATLVMGDALAVTLSSLRGFQPEDFARFHPGGSLGRKLLTRVSDVMHSNLPTCNPQAGFRDVVHVITTGRMGIAVVIEENRLLGVITDGDLRRSFEHHVNPLDLRAADIMTRAPKTIGPDERFADAEEYMRRHEVKVLVVADRDLKPLGLIGVFDV